MTAMPTGFSRPQLVCFSHLRWDFVYQRPQHLMSRAAAQYDVLFVEEPVRRPGAEPAMEMHRRGAVTVLVPVLPESVAEQRVPALVQALLRPHLGAPGGGRVLWYYTPMAMAFSQGIRADAVVYDNMDELSAFLGAPAHLLAQEEALFRRADLVFTGGHSLYAAKRGRHRSVHAFPSSVDAAHFARARRPAQPDPVDQAGIAHPRIGFFGVIDERMDVDLVGALARRRPDWHFVLIGPVVKIDPAILPRSSNLHWLGGRRYEALPDYLAGWDAGFMPFARNESTRFISPTKTPEFLAAGLPVVSTPIADVVDPYGRRGLVQLAEDAAEAEARLSDVLERPRRDWIAAVDGHLATMSWDRTWADMNRLILRSRQPVTVRAGAGTPAAVAAGPNL
ncbi:glycosyltransferase [Ancylobacter lacus]|uniref:glycosyltransferase n=1 Tax=Ancylobacter lacus TaxID=2579970 RepID=UPI001FE8F37E|nr:glycosyltransferase [Ancylobacter lacus]